MSSSVPSADPPTPPRNAEERERDRLERERRRAARESAPAPVTRMNHDPPPDHEDGADIVPEEPPPSEVARAPGPAPARVRSERRRRPPRTTSPARVRPRGERPHRSRRARVGAVAALLAAAAAVWFLVSLFQPFAGSGSGRVIVDIPKGSSASTIGSILERDRVVSSGFFFQVRALVEGKRSALHSGRYDLRRDMSYAAAIDALSKPPPAAILVKVVVPEGFTRAQIAKLAQADSLTGSYLNASSHSRLLLPSRYGAPAGTSSLEGFLFPATYELLAGAPAARFVTEQLSAFKERFGSTEARRARALGVTPYQLLTVASMVEREALLDADRPRIAAVIYNRLRVGMPLGIDASIYYAVELQRGIATYTRELSASDLQIDSPYNTRTHVGLPPTPISNPGSASIDAAAHPAHVPFIYYVAGADGCGEQAFSTTYARFHEDVLSYERAVARNGGHPPVCKHAAAKGTG